MPRWTSWSAGTACTLIAALAAAAGCTAPPTAPPRSRAAVVQKKKLYGTEWRKFKIADVTGYVEVDEQEDDQGREYVTYKVYDGRFNWVGFYTESGATYRFKAGGKAEPLGVLTPEYSLQQLFGVRAEIEPLPMDPTIEEAERRAAKEAEEKAAIEKAKAESGAAGTPKPAE